VENSDKRMHIRGARRKNKELGRFAELERVKGDAFTIKNGGGEAIGTFLA